MYKIKVIAVILLISFIANAAPQPAVCAFNTKCYEEGLYHIDIPHSSLSTYEARKLYNKMINEAAQLVENCTNGSPDIYDAYLAYEMRNAIKFLTRSKMKCQECAKYLNENEANYTFIDLLIKYNNDFKKFIKKAFTTRASANFASKFADFFETHTPWLYEHVLFPSFMSFSRQLKAHPALIILTISGCVIGVLATTTSGLFKRLSNAVGTNIRRLKDFCFGANPEEAQIQDEIDDDTEDIDEDLIKNEDSLSSSVETTKEASSSITCSPDLAECSDINEQ